MVIMNGALLVLRRGVGAWTSPLNSIQRLPLSRHYHFSASLLQRRSSWSGDNDGEDDWGGGTTRRGRDDNKQKPWAEDDGVDQSRQFRRSEDLGDRERDRQQQQHQRNGAGSRGNWRQDRGDRRDRGNGRRGDREDRGDRGERGNWRRGDREDRGDRGNWRRGEREDRGDRRNFQRRDNNRDRFDRQPNNNSRRKQEDPAFKIDIRGLEAEGYVHLYGLAPILSALKANQRDFSPRESEDDMIRERFGDDEDGDSAFESPNSFESPKATAKKPEAQYTPWLFLQDRSVGVGSGRSGDKLATAAQVKELAEERGIPIAYTDKGSLNTLSNNRPHQGFVLRCGALEFEPLPRIPYQDPSSPSLWLVLDEVVDPQNLGALLRSSFFLGGNNNNQQRLGILVCSKNSAPPSPVVSAASAGALELLDIYSTTSLPRTLAAAREEGFRIIGAASSKPRGLEEDNNIELYDLQELPLGGDKPILLVLGSEGHGLRPLVAKLCTDFVRIPRGDDGGDIADDDEDSSNTQGIVDSLNVSVTGGILLWHLLYGSKV